MSDEIVLKFIMYLMFTLLIAFGILIFYIIIYNLYHKDIINDTESESEYEIKDEYIISLGE
jgi:hypothetical protein